MIKCPFCLSIVKKHNYSPADYYEINCPKKCKVKAMFDSKNNSFYYKLTTKTSMLVGIEDAGTTIYDIETSRCLINVSFINLTIDENFHQSIWNLFHKLNNLIIFI